MSKKGWVTLLLALCCFLTASLHIQFEPVHPRVLHSGAQLDSLIAQTTYDFRVPAEQIRIQTIEIDSVFHRKVYTINVSPRFSKTTFHHHLNARLTPLDVSMYGTVQFPEQNLHLNLIYYSTVHRTIKIQVDPDLNNTPVPIPRLPVR